MGFEVVAELPVDRNNPADVYAEGWQSWSPVRMYRLGEESERAPDDRAQTTELRPGKPVAPGVIQAEGVLVIAPHDGPARAWFGPRGAIEVPTLRVEIRAGRALVLSDGSVDSLEAVDLGAALVDIGERLRPESIRSIPPGWSSWSSYFKNVSERDVVENVEAAKRFDLPIEIIQIDDGYELAIGDWLDIAPHFGSLRRASEAIRSAGMRPGVWVAPFLVDPESTLAAKHPDWLLSGDGGIHWGVRMRILDVTNSGAARYLRDVFQTLAGWGFGFFKLDFLYAGAIPGLAGYGEGIRLIRDAVGPEPMVLLSGAPLLPSVGLCDAMRIGRDVLPETPNPQPDVAALTRTAGMRGWMNRKLWINDPDHLVARPAMKSRDAWADFLRTYGGVSFSGDRLTKLDHHGLELTRRVLSTHAANHSSVNSSASSRNETGR
jgi:alpha-galactosidase